MRVSATPSLGHTEKATHHHGENGASSHEIEQLKKKKKKKHQFSFLELEAEVEDLSNH